MRISEVLFVKNAPKCLILFLCNQYLLSILFYVSAPNGPPLNIRVTSRSASSLFFAWDLPEASKQNGVITNCTACVSRSENGPCIQTFTTSKREWEVKNLNAETKYNIRVLSSTKVGHGNYSESIGFFTSASK